MSSLGFLYMLEAFPPAKKLNIGLSLALTNLSFGAPLARLIAPDLLMIGQWHGLYVFEIAIALLAFAAVYLLPDVSRTLLIASLFFPVYYVALSLWLNGRRRGGSRTAPTGP